MNTVLPGVIHVVLFSVAVTVEFTAGCVNAFSKTEYDEELFAVVNALLTVAITEFAAFRVTY
jgi:hypothetical protein